MELEVELKIPVSSLSEVEERLLKEGALRLFEEQQTDIYLQHPCRDLASSDEALRVRRTGSKSFITYKGPKLKSECKARYEVEVEVSDHKLALQLLESLGFRRVIVVEKSRKAYGVGELTVYLDDVKGLGCFVELEARSAKDLKASSEAIKELATKLNLPLNKATTKSYLELLLERAKGIAD